MRQRCIVGNNGRVGVDIDPVASKMFYESRSDDHEAIRDRMACSECTQCSSFAADLFDCVVRGLRESNDMTHSIVLWVGRSPADGRRRLNWFIGCFQVKR